MILIPNISCPFPLNKQFCPFGGGMAAIRMHVQESRKSKVLM